MIKRRFLSGALRASGVLPLLFAAPVALSLATRCKSQVQDTAVEIGGGMRKGEPPMCFQFRTEARPTMNAYQIWLHVNNTCSYSVDCTFLDDVTQEEHRIVQNAYFANSYLLAPQVPNSRVKADAVCVWKP
jgi:hypothetical protein